MIALLVAVAGGLGAVLRLGVDTLVVPRTPSNLPWATLLVNVTGSFALALLVDTGDPVHAVVGAGLLGGYTTFSAASVEAARRLVEGRRVDGLLTVVLMPAACVLAAAAGLQL